MANSEFEYVRKFEQWDSLPPDNWIVVRIDGRGFSKFTKRYEFEKPNDLRAINLMNAAAAEVVRQIVDVVIAYGQSDEYSFVFSESTNLFERRASKLSTTISSLFTAEYCLQWPLFFPSQPLTRPFPTFDGRAVLYPKRKILRDYLAWRQADCHVNNLYNTTFWNIVLKENKSGTEAELELKGTLSGDKNEILYSRFGINYNDELAVNRKGSVVYRDLSTSVADEIVNNLTGLEDVTKQSNRQIEKDRKRKQKAIVKVEHVDIIKDAFWEQRPWILNERGRGSIQTDE